MMIGNDQVPYRFFVKLVARADKLARKFRLLRIVWSRRGGPFGGKGWSSKLAVNLRPRILSLHHSPDDYRMTVCGVELHYARSFGGWNV